MHHRHFDRGEGEDAPKLPRRVYALLDHTEPEPAAGPGPVLAAFDGVDADQFDRLQWMGQPLPLDRPDDLRRAWSGYWQQLRSLPATPWPAGLVDPLEDLSLCRVELHLAADSPLLRRKQDDDGAADPWVEMDLGPGCQQPADAYPLMFGPPVPTFTNFRPTTVAMARSLSEVFGLHHLPDATPDDVAACLARDEPGLVLGLGVYDVGQGNACALLANGQAWLYFDIGCGVYRNAPTTPAALRLCSCGPQWPIPATGSSGPRVVLSHWDADHWAGVYADRPHNLRFLQATWLAPRQEAVPGTPHIALVHDILRAGGRLLLLPAGAAGIPSRVLADGSLLSLHRATGRSRNDSGLVLVVDHADRQRSWLLPGDAAYAAFLPQLGGRVYEACVVPHHGATLQPPAPAAKPAAQRRLVFSFGPNNAHGRHARTHPTDAGVEVHTAAGWNTCPWAHVAAPGQRPPQGDVRATALNGPGGGHRQGVYIEWGLPGNPHPMAGCGQCDAPLSQHR